MTDRGPDWVGLAWAGAPLVLGLMVLAGARLGQVGATLVATARLVVQMSLLALVLRALQQAGGPVPVLAIALAMLGVAAHAAGSRQVVDRHRVRLEAFASLLVGASLALVVAVRLALHVAPWYDPLTVIPLLGMVLGNSTMAVALAAERFARELRLDRDLIELRLSLGATPRQASATALRAAVAAGLAPILNNMTLAGIVAIPGMTTGQLPAGADVGAAVRYQILLYLAIAATVTVSVPVLLANRLRRHFTPGWQLRRELLDAPP